MKVRVNLVKSLLIKVACVVIKQEKYNAQRKSIILSNVSLYARKKEVVVIISAMNLAALIAILHFLLITLVIFSAQR